MEFRIAADIASILTGVVILLVRRGFARDTINTQNRQWRMRMGEREIRRGEYELIIVGALFIPFALFDLSKLVT